MFRALCANPEAPAERGLGIPVRFRTSRDPTAVPPSIPFGDASRTAVFVLVDAEFAAASEWRRYAGSLVDDRGTSDLIVPITLTKPEHLPPPLQNLQAIRLDQTVEPHATTTLRSRVFHSLCRLMDRTPRPGRSRSSSVMLKRMAPSCCGTSAGI